MLRSGSLVSKRDLSSILREVFGSISQAKHDNVDDMCHVKHNFRLKQA